jgi:probable H4MPT-linked C1 transfer pathway protein
MTDVLGLDVGGANLKAAHSRGGARLRPFALWRDPAGLAGALRDLLRDWPPYDRLAVTMTGELCDCYESKRQGVDAILDAVAAAAGSAAVRVWTTEGRFVDPATARAAPLRVAAANWLALATWAGRHAPAGPALLLDVGSTTTDVVPLLDGRPVPSGRTDPERLHSRELVYAGVRRTPLCALLGGEVAAELFATTLDVCLVLGLQPEAPTDTATADGRPATRAAAHARLARLHCADLETTTAAERHALAERAVARLMDRIGSAVGAIAERLPALPRTCVLAGSGEFLGRLVLERRGLPLEPGRVLSVADLLGPGVSEAACAYGVAVLAAED